jgi:putative ABC transport system permease protein
MADYFKYAFRNLTRKHVRTLLTIIEIAIGVASVVVIANISQCGTDAVSGEMDSLGLSGLLITKSGSGQSESASLESQDLNVIKNLDQVDMTTPIITDNTQVSVRNITTDAVLWGIDSNAGNIVSIQPVYGRLFSRKDISTAANVCLVDESFSKRMYKRDNIVGKTINISCGGIMQDFTVVGMIKTGTGLLQNVIGSYIPTFVYVPYTTVQMLEKRSGFDEIAVKLRPDASADGAGKLILSRLNKIKGTENAFVSNNLAKQKNGLLRIMDLVTLILSAVGAVSLLVASLSIMTTMLVSVTERTREIGIKKALGATRANIMLEFLIEAMVLSLTGSAAGIGIGVGISWILAAGFHASFTLRPDIMLIASGFAVFCGTVFSIYPAYQASRLKPVDALRQE